MGEVIGNYEIVAELKRGGMGVVYTARHRTMGQLAVVKKLLPEHTGSADTVQRFFQEAQAAAALDDPGIVRIFDQGVLADGSAYIVMELLQGESLADRLRRDGRVAPSVAITFMRQAARAVSKAHARGIVHRDLKPDNLFIVQDPDVAGGERIKVLDFGIAKLAGDARVKTMTAMPMGTPAYMSPEQWASAGRVDARTDVYAFGIILFEMLTGRLPFEGPGMIEFIDQHRFTPAPPITSVDPSLAAFEPLIARSLAKAPDDRFASLDELVRALPGGTAAMSHPPAAAMGYAPTMASGGYAAPAPSTLGGAAGAMMSAPTAAPRKSALPMVLVAGGVVLAAVVAVLLLASGSDTQDIDAGVIASTPPLPSGSAVVAPLVDAGAIAEAPVDAAAVAEVPVDAAPPASTRSVGGGSVGGTRGGSSSDRPPREKPEPTTGPKPPPTTGPLGSCDEVSCVLSNYEGSCCKKFKKPAPSDSSLPATLSRSDVQNGISRVRGRVAACGDTVKLKIGGDGRVESATANTPIEALGDCVVKAIKTATFPKSQNGVTVNYPFVFRDAPAGY
jgi:hypothetical protein